MRTADLKGKSIERLTAIRKLSEESKHQYLNSLSQLLSYIEKEPDAFLAETKRHPKTFERVFVAFLDKKEKETSASTVALIRNGVKKFLDVNKAEGIDWNYIDDCIPEKKRYGEDRAPTSEEIRRLVNAAELRMKCLILLLCSSGARIGALPYLQWRDIKHLEFNGRTLASVTIYRGELEQYDTFMTPEAYEHLLEYKSQREGMGERITPQSPVFVTASNIDDYRPEKVRGVATQTMKNLLARLMKQVGGRTVIHEGRASRRFEFKQAHGFRKFFKTRMEMSGVKPIITEMLMGHGVGVSNSYMKPTARELVEEYSKAIDELTIIKGKETVTQDMMVATFNRQFLVNSGYSVEEVNGMGDLSKLTQQQVQELIRQRQMQSLGLSGNHQKVVGMGEVEGWVTQGWDFVTSLPDGKAVVRLPTD